MRVDTLGLKIRGPDIKLGVLQIGLTTGLFSRFLIRRKHNTSEEFVVVKKKSSKRSHRHIWLATGVDGLRYRVHEISRDSKITHLHFAVAGDENIRRLHVAMYHL